LCPQIGLGKLTLACGKLEGKSWDKNPSIETLLGLSMLLIKILFSNIFFSGRSEKERSGVPVCFGDAL